MCSENLRLTMMDPKDKGSYCYRATEPIRQYFLQEVDDVGRDTESWVRLRDMLDVDHDSIDEVKDLADPPRHGDITNISGGERATHFDTTRVVIDAFHQEFLRRHGDETVL